MNARSRQTAEAKVAELERRLSIERMRRRTAGIDAAADDDDDAEFDDDALLDNAAVRRELAKVGTLTVVADRC